MHAMKSTLPSNPPIGSVPSQPEVVFLKPAPRNLSPWIEFLAAHRSNHLTKSNGKCAPPKSLMIPARSFSSRKT